MPTYTMDDFRQEMRRRGIPKTRRSPRPRMFAVTVGYPAGDSVGADVVQRLVRDDLVSVDPSVTCPVERTALLMIAVERWWTTARKLRGMLFKGER